MHRWGSLCSVVGKTLLDFRSHFDWICRNPVLTALHKRRRILSLWCKWRTTVCAYVLRLWCLPQWVSWIRPWCLLKLQGGWHLSINPTSWGALYPNHSGFPFSFCSYITGEDERNSHMDCSLNLLLQTEINLVTFLLRFHAELYQHPGVTHPPTLYPPFFIIPFLSVCLSFFAFLAHILTIFLQRCTADVSRQEALCTSECYK